MKQSNAQTIEQVLFDRMGISVEDAVATGMDVVDEKVAAAVESGVDVDQRMAGLGQLLEQLSEPATIKALGVLLQHLPQLAQLAKLANEMPGLVAMLGDIVDDYQQRCAAQGIDVEKGLVNGVQASLWLGSQVEAEHLKRIGELLGSDIFNPQAVSVVGNAAKSLANAQQAESESSAKKRIGIFGLLAALRKPEIQRSLAFAVRFGENFGENLDNTTTTN